VGAIDERHAVEEVEGVFAIGHGGILDRTPAEGSNKINRMGEAGNLYGITKFSKLTELGRGWMRKESFSSFPNEIWEQGCTVHDKLKCSKMIFKGRWLFSSAKPINHINPIQKNSVTVFLFWR
jgi:hypothetical protein